MEAVGGGENTNVGAKPGAGTEFVLVLSGSKLFPLLSCYDGAFPAQCCHATPALLFKLSLELDLVTLGFGISSAGWNVVHLRVESGSSCCIRACSSVFGRKGDLAPTLGP